MIENSIQVGDPVEHRGVVIAPLFPRSDPNVEYVTLEEALALGFRITEVDAAGSVPELIAFNPLDTPVLCFPNSCSNRSVGPSVTRWRRVGGPRSRIASTPICSSGATPS